MTENYQAHDGVQDANHHAVNFNFGQLGTKVHLVLHQPPASEGATSLCRGKVSEWQKKIPLK